MKPYNYFTDIYGNEYNFNDYNEFAKFWFSQKVKTLKLIFLFFYCVLYLF